MTKKTIRIAQVSIGGIFTLAVLFFIAGIMLDKKAGPVKARETFDTFLYEVSNLAAKYEPSTVEFQTHCTPLIDISAYRSLQLFLNGTVIFTYDAAEPVTMQLVHCSGEAKTIWGNTLTVEAQLYAFKPQALLLHAKIAFGLILLGTLGALALLLAVHLYSRRKPVNRKPSYREVIEHLAAEKDSADEAEAKPESEAELEPEQEPELELEPEVQQQAEDEEAMLLATFESEADQEEDDFDPIGEMEEENRQSAADDSIIFEAETAKPAKDALTFALDNELADAIASEQDVSLLMVQLPALTEESATRTQLKKLLNERLGNQGFTESYHEHTAIVVKNATVDMALAFGQSLHTAIQTLLQRNGEHTQVAIGISSRSLRSIDASRLITEAEQAALHADAENPIIAFRVNPEKYKQFVQETA